MYWIALATMLFRFTAHPFESLATDSCGAPSPVPDSLGAATIHVVTADSTHWTFTQQAVPGDNLMTIPVWPDYLYCWVEISDTDGNASCKSNIHIFTHPPVSVPRAAPSPLKEPKVYYIDVAGRRAREPLPNGVYWKVSGAVRKLIVVLK